MGTKKIDPDKESGVYTADMGQPPMDPEVAPPTPKASAPKPVSYTHLRAHETG
jgi:hypothetical protein